MEVQKCEEIGSSERPSRQMHHKFWVYSLENAPITHVSLKQWMN